MILLTAETSLAYAFSRITWEQAPAVAVAGSESWYRASRRLLNELADGQGHQFPLRDEVWVSVYPPRNGQGWRVESEALGLAIVGRGDSGDDALNDWRKRFQMTAERFLEMRPFEMTSEDRELWNRLQAVLDVPRYRASKPLIFRQAGKVVKSSHYPPIVVQWEDGNREQVNPLVFDEPFTRFRIGQPFEVMVTRHPVTFQLLRADALRKLPANRPVLAQRSQAIWDRAVGGSDHAPNPPPQPDSIDEQFWLTPSDT